MQTNYTGIIDQYRECLPIAKHIPAIALAEGNTPLIPLQSISQDLPIPVKIYAKYEGLNPTGSFKDRGMTVAIT